MNMSEQNNENTPVERTEERHEEKVVQSPQADEGGPLGNVTEAVTSNEPTETVVERSDESVKETPAQPDNASER
jgi:hypothetical protein